MRASRIMLVFASLLLSACEEKKELPFEVVRRDQVDPSEPCDPWEGRTASLAKASVKAVFAGSGRKFLLMEVQGGAWIRVFEFSEDEWIEVNGSSIHFADAPSHILSFEDLKGRAQTLVFSSDLSWVGIARESGAGQDFTKFEQWPGFEKLKVVQDFKLDSMDSLRPRAPRKRMRFYGTFGEKNENHLLILDVDELLAGFHDGIFVGPSSAVSGPKHSLRLRFKDGGTQHYSFGDGKNGGRLEYKPNQVDEVGAGWKLYVKGERVPLLNLTGETTSSDLLESLTFRYCDRAHEQRRAKSP